METNNNPSQPSVPRQPQTSMPRGTQPLGRRPMVDGFTPRRPAATPGHHPLPSRHVTPAKLPSSAPSRPPAATSSSPAAPPSSPQAARPLAPAPTPVHATIAQRPNQVAPRANQHAFGPKAAPEMDAAIESTPVTHPPKEHSQTGHAGLAGFISFLIFAALLLTPLIPGKVTQNFPLASSTFSTGEQSLDCLGQQGTIKSSTAYDSKLGSPLVYAYHTNTTQSATCDGKLQSAVIGHTSQFNPLGLLLDIVLALALAIAVARIWRVLFGEKRHTAHRLGA